MKIRMKYNIIKSKKGFSDFIKYNLAEARRFIISCDRSPLYFNEHLNEYSEALEIDEIGRNYAAILETEEAEALLYFRYHSPIDKKPINYERLLENSYHKWLKVIPKNNLRLRPKKIGKIMKLVRTKNNISIISLSIIMGVDRNTIAKYECGDRLPSLEYFYKFCIVFRLSMDNTLKNYI